MDLQGKRVLVLGGSLFMGPPTIQALLEAGANVTVMNRGVSDPAGAQGFGDAVTQVRVDRKSDEFPAFLRGSGSWDAIVDYIAYTVPEVEPLLVELGPEKMGHYIYISSDSTYMGSDPAKFVREDGRLLEASTVRHTDPALHQVRHDSDTYGSNKLFIEEYLAEQEGLLWTALRLPDVLGPHDRSNRQSTLLQMLVRGEAIGTQVKAPSEKAVPGWRDGDGNSHLVGNVYAPDVARACVCVLEAGAQSGGVGLNIASAEAPTWVEFVQLVETALAKHVPNLAPASFDDAKPCPRGLPSVDADVGALHVGLAERVCGWTPTPMAEWVEDTVAWAVKEDTELLANTKLGDRANL